MESNKTICVQVPISLYNKLKDLSNEYNVNLSNLIRLILTERVGKESISTNKENL